MLGQYGLFEEQLSGLKGNERLDKLFYLLTSSKGKQISLSYYLQENWSTIIKELAEKSEETALRKVFELKNTKSKEREFAYDRSIKPCLMIDEENNHSFNFANVEDVADLLKSDDFVSIFETQIRCGYKKPEFVAEYGELYQKPLHAYLKGKGYNDDCDGVLSLTVDFDSDAGNDVISTLISSSKNDILNEKRSKAFYADSVSRFALLFHEQLPKDLEPTSIRFTGRGFQFVYSLKTPFYFNKSKEEEKEQQKNFVLDVVSWLRIALEIELTRFSTENDGLLPQGVAFHIDKAFERNICQTRRVPGSFNPKTGLSAAYIFLQEHPLKTNVHLRELVDYCKENYKEEYFGKEYQTKAFKTSGVYSEEESLLFAEARLSSLTNLIHFKKSNDTLVGSRHNFLTQVANSIADVFKHQNDGCEPSIVDLLSKVVTFNADHLGDVALNFSEVRSLTKGVLKRRTKILQRGDSTNLSNQTIINFLDLTEKEQSFLRKTSQQVKRTSLSLKNKYSLTAKVVKVHELKEEGYSYKEIAASTGMALSTVYRYGTSFYEKLKQENFLKLKKEKELLKHELKTSQKAIYDFVYEDFTKLILVKKMSSGLVRMFGLKTSKLNLKKVIQKMLEDFYRIIHSISRHRTLSSMKKLRDFADEIIRRLLKEESVHNIINEYSLIQFLSNKKAEEGFIAEYYERVHTYFKHLISTTISKYIDKIRHVRTTPFFLNQSLLTKYKEYDSQLPFPNYLLENSFINNN